MFPEISLDWLGRLLRLAFRNFEIEVVCPVGLCFSGAAANVALAALRMACSSRKSQKWAFPILAAGAVLIGLRKSYDVTAVYRQPFDEHLCTLFKDISDRQLPG